MKPRQNITIIGAGVVGLSIAYALSTVFDTEINLVEKNEKITGDNQSTRNSGVIHAGIYYDNRIMPKKAALCVEGNRLLYEFCAQHKVAHKRVGKFVVATCPDEIDYLEDTFRIARENNVPDVRMVDADFVKKREPNVSCIAALYCKSSGVIDPVGYLKKLHGLAKQNHTAIYVKSHAIDILPGKHGFTVTIQSGDHKETFDTDIVINCAGLNSDTIAKLVNPETPYEIIPMKGEAVKFLRTQSPDLFTSGMNIYPTPHGVYPEKGGKAQLPFAEFETLYLKGLIKKTLGVHLTPLVQKDQTGRMTLSDEISIGPAMSADGGKQSYDHTYDKNYYVRRVRSFFPHISASHLDFYQTGILAMAKGQPDFIIETDPNHKNFINLIGIDSPGLTSSLAIGKYVCEMVKPLVH